jgi:ankyrin repeat protein
MANTWWTRSNRASALFCLVAAIAAFSGAAFATPPWSLPLVLVGDSLVMLTLALRWRVVADSGLAVIRRGSAYTALLAGYAVLVWILIGVPLHWLEREPSLGASLGLSGAVVIALLALWRLWPAFGLPFLQRRPPGPRARSPLSASVRDAWNLTADNELFFSHGLAVAIAAFALVQGALSLCGADAPVPADVRWPAWAVYAAVLVPSLHWCILRRCVAARLIELRRQRAERVAAGEPSTASPLVAPAPPDLPARLGPAELDAMLLRCARAGQTQLALAALERGADPNCVPPPDDRDQRSVVMLAAVNPDVRLLRGLIARGADLNRVHAGMTPLIAATRDSREGRPDAVMMLLTNGADPRVADADGETPLHFAALSIRPVVAALLCDAGAMLDAVNRQGMTPLGVACAAGNWELVRFLLERGARLEVEHAHPAILAATDVTEDDPQGAKLLLKRKARVDARGPLGRTALMTAALHGHAAIAETLLAAGAAVDLADAHGTTALMEAARAGAAAVLEVLARHRPAPDAIDVTGRSALMIACQSAHASEDIVRRLLALGAKPDLALPDGRRAVDFAAAAGRWPLVALLDPAYPRPTSVTAAPDASVADAPAHLLDALRFGHAAVVERFAASVRRWPESELACLFAELLSHPECAPRQWLLQRGLDPNAALADGTPLLARALAELPAALAAAADLLAAGAYPTAGALARVGEAWSRTDPARRAALEDLGLALIERGADLFAAAADGQTPLAHAVTAGSTRLTAALLARGVDPNARDRHGRSPLFAALLHPPAVACELVRLLIAAGAQPEARAANGETPLGLALARPEAELARWLNWPAWKPPPRRLQDADLVAAAAVGDLAAVEKLLELGLALEATDAHGATALLRAAGGGHARLVAWLLERGADPAHGAATGATALSAAVTARRDDVVATLLAHGVAPDQPLRGGGTALMIAAALGHPEIAARLLGAGADVDAADEAGTRALHAAAHFAFHSHDGERARQLLALLLDAGASVDARNAAGQTALLLLLGARAEPGATADQRALLAVLPLLLARGADVNAQDRRGVGALHACAMHGLLLPARALLAAGADPALRDERGRTAREVAHLLGFIDLATELGGGTPAAARTPAR